MLPVIAIIGRPNVGKSTLFNCLTESRDALVVDVPGVTRDRQYGEGVLAGRAFAVIDTGGVETSDHHDMGKLIDDQVAFALEEADIIYFMVDAKLGLIAADEIIASRLRVYSKKIYLLVNKVDRESAELVCADFYSLGFGDPIAISAKQGRGIRPLIQETLSDFPDSPSDVEVSAEEGSIHIAVVGRPNVGKSTLINRMLGEDRLIVCDYPGTTRDSIEVPIEYRQKKYVLVDTAGVRRSHKVTDTVEKFSVIKTLQAMRRAHVVIIVVDAQDVLGEQDMRLIGLVAELGKGLVIAFNKWDGMDEYDRQQFKAAVERKLVFVEYARRYTISALHGTGVGKLYHAIQEAYTATMKVVPTTQLTKTLEMATRQHQPPVVRGRRIRLRYAHMGGNDPFEIIVHGKQTAALPGSYQRYLSNFFRKQFDLHGIPVLIKLKSDKNPYHGTSTK